MANFHILKRANLGVKGTPAENTVHETTQTFIKPGGKDVTESVYEAITEFMKENYPNFGEKSLSFPEQAVDYGLRTQALVLTDAEIDTLAKGLPVKGEKEKFLAYEQTQVNKGAVSEIEVFNWAKKSEDLNLMSTFWSYDQKCLHELLGIKPAKNQEIDVIVILAKYRKVLIIEVKSSGGNLPVIDKACKTLENAKTFVNQVFHILGIEESEKWEFIPLIALPNVESREKLNTKGHDYILDHILTKTELERDLIDVLQINQSYEDVSVYRDILSLLAASYHATAVKKGSIGGVQFVIKDLVQEASGKLAGKAQIGKGFDPRE